MAESQNHTNQSESKPFDHEVPNRLAAGLGDHADSIENITAQQLKKISAPRPAS
jgi:hypothetical protein